MKKILVPFGIDDFRKLVTIQDSYGNHNLFVDKSLLIKNFL